MWKLDSICPECYADTLLVEILGFKPVNHKSGIGQVFILFDNSKNKNLHLVGIIDDDKKKSSNFTRQFEEVKSADGLRLFQHKTNPKHQVIVICPALEKWILFNCEQKNVSLEKYKMTHSPESLKRVFKDKKVGDNQQVKALFNDLKQKKAPGFETLKNWIREILDQ